MSLAHDIQELRRQSLAALDASHDYYFHTKAAWQMVQKSRGKRRRGFPLNNRATGTKTDQKILIGLVPKYVTGNLIHSTFQEFVSIFEDFFFDLLRLWLVAYPGSLSEKDIKFGLVLKAPDKAAVTLAVVDRELNELKYEKIADWFGYLEKRLKLGCPAADVIETLAEIKASRDIVVHNKGIVNAVYLWKAGKRARFKEGERLEIPEQYHRECWETIKQVIGERLPRRLRENPGRCRLFG